MRARRLIPVAAVLVAVASACTGSPPPNGSSNGPAHPTRDPGATEFQPGQFAMRWNDSRITFSMQGSGGTLTIDNGSGGDLGAPGLYAILADGDRRDATIASAAPVPDGRQVSFDVVFPDDVDETTVGLVILLIGGDDWGALAPVPAG